MLLFAHFTKPWYRPIWLTIYFFILGSLVVIYSKMLSKSRKSQKKLAELQKIAQETDFTKPNLSFNKNKGLLKKKIHTSNLDPVELLYVKFESGKKFKTFDYENKDHQIAGRKNSVIRKIAVLTSQSKAATYILVLLLIFLFTWMPYNSYTVADTIYHLGRNDTFQVNLERKTVEHIFSCMQTLVRYRNCSLNEKMTIEEMDTANKVLDQISHTEKLLYYEYFTGIVLPTFHAFINPFLYALWYSEFRMYVIAFPQLFFKKKQTDDISHFKIQYVSR